MILRNISTKTLAKIAVYGAIGVCTTGMLLQWRVKENIKNSEFFREALAILKKHEGAKSLLGLPIKDGSLVLNSSINLITESEAKMQVPVKGSKDKGTMYFWADKNSEKWNVYRIELELNGDDTKRLLIKNERDT